MPTTRTSHLIPRAALAARITLIAFAVTAFWLLAVAFTNPDALKHLEGVMALYTLIVTGIAAAACLVLMFIQDERDERIEALTQQVSDLSSNLKNEAELANIYAMMIVKLDNGQMRREFLERHSDDSRVSYEQWVREWVEQNVGLQYADICTEVIVDQAT